MLHKCSVFSNSSITRNLPTVDLVKNPDLVKFELLTKNFTKSGVYCTKTFLFGGKIKHFDFDIFLVKILGSISEIKINVAI